MQQEPVDPSWIVRVPAECSGQCGFHGSADPMHKVAKARRPGPSVGKGRGEVGPAAAINGTGHEGSSLVERAGHESGASPVERAGRESPLERAREEGVERAGAPRHGLQWHGGEGGCALEGGGWLLRVPRERYGEVSRPG